MTTDDLIDDLTRRLSPVSRWTVPRRLLVGLGVGAVPAAAWVVFGLGVRPDLAFAVRAPPFWFKLTYTLAMAAVGVWVASRAVRPAGETAGRALAILPPLSAVGLASSIQMMADPHDDPVQLLMGHTASTCPELVVLCSAAPLIGSIWSARGCAPTALVRAGAALGLAAGGVGGAIYSLHCTEAGMAFLGAWYTLGLFMVVLIGSAVSPRLFRW